MGLSGASELKELMRSKSESNEFYFTAQEAKEMGAADFIGSIKLQPTVGFNVMVIPPEVEKTPEEELEENVDTYLNMKKEMPKQMKELLDEIKKGKKPEKKPVKKQAKKKKVKKDIWDS